MTNFYVCRDPQDLYEQAAALFACLAGEAVAETGRFTVALSGGSTPKGVYALLGETEIARQIPWAQVHLFWGDERCVPPTHPESNYRLVEELLLSRISIPARNVHRMPAELPPTEAARAYEQILRDTFGFSAETLPRFDLVFLGMGTDGPTASLFPGTVGLREEKRLVIAHSVEKLKAWRVTLTPPVFNQAAHIVFLICGADKAVILKEVFHDASQPERLPVQLIHSTHGRLLWLVDQAAASAVTIAESGQADYTWLPPLAGHPESRPQRECLFFLMGNLHDSVDVARHSRSSEDCRPHRLCLSQQGSGSVKDEKTA